MAPGEPDLPQPLTSFVGRKPEIAELRELLRRGRLVTLTGAGGSGKSRLALEVARLSLDRFAYGVFFVELAPLTDPRLTAREVASTLRIPEQAGRPIMATLSDALRSKRLLIVLDNCEHLTAEVAGLADALLRVCPALQVLATSQIPLGIGGERIWRVEPLRLAEGIKLFVERASHVRTNFESGAESRAAIEEICGRLDGMPLAIELAAAQVKVLHPSEIVSRLRDRFELLTGGSSTALPRHQTLRATMDWSYELLPEPARRLWSRLSVFAGGFRLDATETVCSGAGIPKPQVLNVLTILVNYSLVISEDRAGTRRYRLLETVRQYGLEKLEFLSETALIRERHLGWYLGLAKEAERAWRGPNQRLWLDRFQEELDNVRTALDWAKEHRDLVDTGLQLASGLWLFWIAGNQIGERPMRSHSTWPDCWPTCRVIRIRRYHCSRRAWPSTRSWATALVPHSRDFGWASRPTMTTSWSVGPNFLKPL